MLISDHDLARQRHWSAANLPDLAQVLTITRGDMSGSTGWVPSGIPIPCRVSLLRSQGGDAVMGLAMQHRLMWHIVFAAAVVIDVKARLNLTIERNGSPFTMQVEVLQPAYRSSATETRVIVRGPL